MRKLLIALTMAFAFSSTPAIAIELPYGDDDQSHYGDATFACPDGPCTFSATSTDSTVVHTYPGQNPQTLDCTWMALDYELVDPRLAWGTATHTEGTCFVDRELMPCVYSPSGFANGLADLEIWMRTTSTYAKASGTFVEDDEYYLDSWSIDQYEVNTDPQVVVDGTFEVDEGSVKLYHGFDGGGCWFPELNS